MTEQTKVAGHTVTMFSEVHHVLATAPHMARDEVQMRIQLHQDVLDSIAYRV